MVLDKNSLLIIEFFERTIYIVLEQIQLFHKINSFITQMKWFLNQIMFIYNTNYIVL